MRRSFGWVLAVALAFVASEGAAQTRDLVIGGDVLRAGESSTPLQATRDVLATGFAVQLDGSIAQNGHAAGFDVSVDATTGSNLYAAGMTVGLRAPVGGNLTAAGFTVRTGPLAVVGGNARLAGATVTVNGPVQGALVAVGNRVTLNSVVSGDAVLAADTLTFGPDARIEGQLTYATSKRMEIPDFVITADRVSFEPYEPSEVVRTALDHRYGRDMPVLPTFLTVFGAFLVVLGFFVVIGALFLTLAPVTVRDLRQAMNARPGKAMVVGVIGLSTLFGLVPVSAVTIVGIPLVPLVLLAIVLTWTLGYLLGTYVLAMRVLKTLGAAENPTLGVRLLALVVGVSIGALLNFIPFIGWMANFALVLFGVGGMTTALFDRMVGTTRPDRAAGKPPIQPTLDQE